MGWACPAVGIAKKIKIKNPASLKCIQKGACDSHPRRWLRRGSRRQLTGNNHGELKKTAAENDLGNGGWKSTISCNEDRAKVSRL
jgi:hypothetical protein